MHVFASLLKFSQIFSYNFIKVATVFCFNVILQKRAVKNFNNTIIALRNVIKLSSFDQLEWWILSRG